jgi:hypothetical protein
MSSSAMHCRRAPLTFLASSSPWRYNLGILATAVPVADELPSDLAEAISDQPIRSVV